jgi:2-iminobutanoate/2-iminopropanoate deaminase
MNREPIATEDAPAAIGPYSQAIKANELLFCSGQIALDPATGKLVGEGDVRAQTERVMKNLGAVLEAGGASFRTVLKTTIFVADMSDFAAVNEIYGGFFEGDAPPARATVEVSRLPKDVMVEVDAIAVAQRSPTHEVD